MKHARLFVMYVTAPACVLLALAGLARAEDTFKITGNPNTITHLRAQDFTSVSITASSDPSNTTSDSLKLNFKVRNATIEAVCSLTEENETGRPGFCAFEFMEMHWYQNTFTRAPDLARAFDEGDGKTPSDYYLRFDDSAGAFVYLCSDNPINGDILPKCKQMYGTIPGREFLKGEDFKETPTVVSAPAPK